MRLVIARIPALEAALIRFDGWWAGLSRRERILTGTLAALLAGVVLIYGVVKPIQAARAQAIADIRTYETLTARIRAAGTLARASVQPRRAGPAAQIVAGSASSFGFTAAMEAIPGGVRATIADASYGSLVAWLADLGATSSLAIRRVSIQKRPAPGRVSATVEFAG